MQTFQDMALPEALRHTLEHMKFNEPTPIQAQAIPLALAGKDILGTAQTGTGKTGAFGVPLVATLLNDHKRSALVMTPTRELAAQVMIQIQAMLGKKSKINTALLIGGDSMPKQLQQISKKPRIIVGTPGRINDHLKRNGSILSKVNFLVLDETDRMLDMGFSVQIDAIMKHMHQPQQTLLFSATLPKNIERMADKYLNNPERISIAPTSQTADNIKQTTLKLAHTEKYEQLLQALQEREGSVVLFMKTKHSADRMATKLDKTGFSARAIHGDLRQNKRDRVVAAYRKESFRILVATDIAARGLDIPHIRHVINYDMPQVAEDYIHRIGRTARAGAQGEALNFVCPADAAKWQAIQRLLNPDSKTAKKTPAQPKHKQGKSSRKSTAKATQHKHRDKAKASHQHRGSKPTQKQRPFKKRKAA